MKKYVGVKLVEAESMTRQKFNGEVNPSEITEGYLVVYPDGYKSWSPKEVFENAYSQVGDNNTIQEYNVNEFIADYDIKQWGDKTTIVNATLANGFIIFIMKMKNPKRLKMFMICFVSHQVWMKLNFLHCEKFLEKTKIYQKVFK